jgi:ATP-dependent protease ClpP protease subunit
MNRYVRLLKNLFLGILVIIAILIVAVVTFVITMSSSDPRDADQDIREVGKVRIASEASSEYIAYTGPITEDGFTELLNVYQDRLKKNDIKVTTLTINSTGGNALVGLNMANWVLSEKLNVLVSRRCFSACANYVFVAGKHKILYDHSQVMWHGSATNQQGIEAGMRRGLTAAANKYSDAELLNEYSEWFEQYSAKITADFPKVTYEEYSAHFIAMLRENEFSFKGVSFDAADVSKAYEFYAKIDVDPMIGNYGFLQINNSMEELPQAFYYSLADLETMNVRNIILRDSVWEPDYSIPIFKVDSKYVRP